MKLVRIKSAEKKLLKKSQKRAAKRGHTDLKSPTKSSDEDCKIVSEGDSPEAKKPNNESNKKLIVTSLGTPLSGKMEVKKEITEDAEGIVS